MVASVIKKPPNQPLWFAKAPADLEINNIAAAIPPPFVTDLLAALKRLPKPKKH